MIIELKKKPADNDIIIFKNNEFKAVDIGTITKPLEEEIATLKEENKKQEEAIQRLVDIINEKLKGQHEVLQVLTKENK